MFLYFMFLSLLNLYELINLILIVFLFIYLTSVFCFEACQVPGLAVSKGGSLRTEFWEKRLAKEKTNSN